MGVFSENKLKSILKEIRLAENRDTADAMERMGLFYNRNFGVSLPNLKEIAKKYKPDGELARLLRKKGFRETLILSFMVEDTDNLTKDDLVDIFKFIVTQELAEQFVFNVLDGNDKFYYLAGELLDTGEEFLISAGFIFLSRIALRDAGLKDDFFEGFIDGAISYSGAESIFIRKSVARALRQIALRNARLKNKVLLAVSGIKENGDRRSLFVYEEVVPLIS